MWHSTSPLWSLFFFFFFCICQPHERPLGAASTVVGINARRGVCSPGSGLPTFDGFIILKWKLASGTVLALHCAPMRPPSPLPGTRVLPEAFLILPWLWHFAVSCHIPLSHLQLTFLSTLCRCKNGGSSGFEGRERLSVHLRLAISWLSW